MLKIRGLRRLVLTAALLAGLLQMVVVYSQPMTNGGLRSGLQPNNSKVTRVQSTPSVHSGMETVEPKLVLENVASAILDGPPLTADFQGQVDLQVALRPLKSLRGQSNVVPMTGTFSSLGRGSGLARWQLSVGNPSVTTMNFFCQQHEMVVNSTAPPTSPGVVSIQPHWFHRIGSNEQPSQASGASLYGSPVSLIQWLPHHFEFCWGSLDESSLVIQRLKNLPAEPAVAVETTVETTVVTIVGRVRSIVANHHGIQVPSSRESASRERVSSGSHVDSVDWTEFFSWARHVPLPAPHVFEIKLKQGPGGVWQLASLSFLRIHPLRPELEEMVRWDWGDWQLTPGLSLDDVKFRTKNP